MESSHENRLDRRTQEDTGDTTREEEADENNDIESNETKKERWQRIYVMYFVMFIESLTFSITFTSIWPFLKKLNPDVNTTILGIINCSRSVAELLASFAFGYWYDTRGAIEPLIVSNVLFFIGNILYACAENFGRTGIWVILCSRLLLGLSGGGIAVSRAVVAKLSRREEISKTMSHLSMCVCVSFLIGPVVQTILTPLGPKGVYVPWFKLHFNMYSAPSYIMMLLGVINIVLQLKFFCKGGIDTGHVGGLGTSSTESVMTDPVDKRAVVVMLCTHFVLMLTPVVVETLNSPIMMDILEFRPDETVFYGGIIVCAFSVVGIFCFPLIPSLCKRVNDRKLMLVALFLGLLSAFLHLPWGPGYLKLKPPIKYSNGTSIYSEQSGCPYENEWCHHTPRLPLAQFIVAITISAVTDPLGFALSSILYTKIIGPFNQGTYMGWYTGAESLAKVIVPFVGAFIYARLGIRGPFGCLSGMSVVSLILLVATWKRIVPYNEQSISYQSLQ